MKPRMEFIRAHLNELSYGLVKLSAFIYILVVNLCVGDTWRREERRCVLWPCVSLLLHRHLIKWILPNCKAAELTRKF